jgi:hypothetical protein
MRSVSYDLIPDVGNYIYIIVSVRLSRSVSRKLIIYMVSESFSERKLGRTASFAVIGSKSSFPILSSTRKASESWRKWDHFHNNHDNETCFEGHKNDMHVFETKFL